jgi:hypothetical protein
MNVAHSNTACTVGIVTSLDTPPDYVGTFTPKYLREWAQLLCDTYGEDAEVRVDLHTCRFKKCVSIAASDDGEEPYVMVVGHEVL